MFTARWLTFCARLLLALGLTLISAPVIADDACKSQGHLDLPITMVEGVPLVRLTINNKEAVLILDTGAETTVMSMSAADRLELPRSMAYARRMHGLGGGVGGGVVALPGLVVGGAQLPNFGALVGPIDLPKLGGSVPDGLLGADILSDYDVDLDLAHSRVRLLCSVGEPDWGRPYSVVGANLSVHDRLFFGSTLDGKKIAAIIDTGAQHTVIDSRAALAAGADPQALRREPAKAVRGISGASGIEARPNRFHQLVIGDETLPNPTLLVAPLDLEDADLILGADFLRDRRIRLSYRAHRIFLGRP